MSMTYKTIDRARSVSFTAVLLKGRVALTHMVLYVCRHHRFGHLELPSNKKKDDGFLSVAWYIQIDSVSQVYVLPLGHPSMREKLPK
jgi:hypothetical protein